MIFKTQRQYAESECETIKSSVKSSLLNYYVKETAFTLTIKIRKSFVQEYPSNYGFANSTPTRLISSEETTDSGVQTSTAQNKDEIETLKKELASTILDSNERFNNVSKDLDAKNEIIRKLNSELKSKKEENDQIKKEKDEKTVQLKEKNKSCTEFEKDLKFKKSQIEKLNSELNSFKDSSKNLKVEISTKTEQLKQKNEAFNDQKAKFAKLLEEKENSMKKIDNLEIHNKKISSEKDKLVLELKSIKMKINSKKYKTQETQTILKSTPSISTQTMSSSISNLSAATQTSSNISNVSTQTISPPTTLKQPKETSNKTADITTNSLTNSENIPKQKKTFIKSVCKSCHYDHTSYKLSWPLRQYCFAKFIPTSDNQLEWPDKQVVDKYLHDYDDHKCGDCVQITSYWKYRICDEFGVSTKFGESKLSVCRNNLVNFGELPWWEKMGIP